MPSQTFKKRKMIIPHGYSHKLSVKLHKCYIANIYYYTMDSVTGCLLMHPLQQTEPDQQVPEDL